MTRALTTAFRTNVEASNTDEIGIIFATVSHPGLEEPLPVNSDVVDFVLGGTTYKGVAFSASLLTDDDQPPVGKISIENVDRVIGEAVQLLSTAPAVKVEVYARSDFDNSTPRMPIGTPTPQYTAQGLFLRNINGDVLGITADLGTYDIANEPWPATRSTMQKLPALFARAPAPFG
jgi:hypothetical protein